MLENPGKFQLKKALLLETLEKRFVETAKYDIAQERLEHHWVYFANILKKEGLYRE